MDTTAPTTALLSQPAAQVASHSATFTFNGSDGAGTGVAFYECKFDAGAFATCTSPKSYSGVAAGSHTFSVRAVDGAGNSDATPATSTWSVNLLGPEAPVIDAAPVTGVRRPAVTITSDPNITVEVKIDGIVVGTATTNASGTATFTPTADVVDGTHTITATGIDGLGNRGAVSNPITVKVLATAPGGPAILTAPSGNSPEKNPTFTFSTAGGSTLECKLDDGSWAACQPTTSFSNLPDGSHTLQVRQSNEAGVVSPTTSYTWVIDTTKPALPGVTTKPPATTTDTTAKFGFLR